ncbi:MAG: cytochrome c biogenesis protein CcdA [Myxococcota bacterium]
MFESLQQALDQQYLILAVLSTWISGLLSAFSPCVYPLIPITLGVMSGADNKGNAWRGLRLSMAYVSGMVLLFCMLGILSASAGLLLGAALQQSWFLCLMAGFFFLMACNLLGVFELSIPVWLSQTLSQVGGAGYWGAFFMGLVAGVLAVPCSGPVLAVILSLIAQQGNTTLGILLMTSYALGLGLPFLLLGTFSYAVNKMPKSGPWMFGIKRFLAVCILLVAVYYLQLGLPSLADAMETFAIRNPLPISSIGLITASLVFWNMQWHTRNIILFVRVMSATTLAVGLWLGILWSHQLQQQGKTPLTWQTVTQEDLPLERVEQLLETARQSNRFVILNFSARWCSACRMLERITFSNKQAVQAMEGFVCVKIDLTVENPDLKQLQKRYEVRAVPTTIILDPHSENRIKHISGFIPPRRLVHLLRQLK